jgi:hypothetical protein
MSYVQCKEAFITKGRTLSSLFPKSYQVSDDEENIKRGGDYFLVTLPSSFSSRAPDAHHKDMTWIVLFDLYVRFTTKKESTLRFEAARDQVITFYHSDPWLNNTTGVSNVLISAAGEVLQDIAGDNPNFIIQTMSASISQRVALNLRRST